MTREETIWERFTFLYLVQNLGQGQQPEKSAEGSPLASSGHKETTGLPVMIKLFYKAQRPERKSYQKLNSCFFLQKYS